MLHNFTVENRDEIIRRGRAKVATRGVPVPTKGELDHGVPVFLDQLSHALRVGASTGAEVSRAAILHDHDLLLEGCTVSQVVHDYGAVCQAITELAADLKTPISAEDFGILNRCLDDAVAGAVTECERGHNQAAIDDKCAHENERLAFFAHEMRNAINTALVAFEVLKTRSVNVSGTISAVLHRNLVAARELCSRSLGEVRLTQGIQNRERFLIADFVREVASGAKLMAHARHVRLIVDRIVDDVTIEADRQILAAVMGNLLQNAMKFTRKGTSVTLTVDASADRVLIEVQDECGGLSEDRVEELFRPFEQRGANRSGLGLGLAFSRWGAEANNGRVYARNLPGHGCVFTVDLPRAQGLAGAVA